MRKLFFLAAILAVMSCGQATKENSSVDTTDTTVIDSVGDDITFDTADSLNNALKDYEVE